MAMNDASVFGMEPAQPEGEANMVKRICHQLEQKCRDVDLRDWY